MDDSSEDETARNKCKNDSNKITSLNGLSKKN